MQDYKCVCRIYDPIEKTFTTKIITAIEDMTLVNDWLVGKVTCSWMPGWDIKVHFPLDSPWKLLSYHGSSEDEKDGRWDIRVRNKLEPSVVCRIHLKQMDMMFGKLFQLLIDNTTVKALRAKNNIPFHITFETSGVPLKRIKELGKIKYELLSHVGIFTEHLHISDTILNQYEVIDCTDDEWFRSEYLEDEDAICYQGSELFAVDRFVEDPDGECAGEHVVAFFDLAKEYPTDEGESDV